MSIVLLQRMAQRILTDDAVFEDCKIIENVKAKDIIAQPIGGNVLCLVDKLLHNERKFLLLKMCNSLSFVLLLVRTIILFSELVLADSCHWDKVSHFAHNPPACHGSF